MSLVVRTWWLYYADYADDGGLRGVCIVRNASFLGAALEARRLGISPGGQVQGWPVPPEFEAELAPHLGKHLTEEQALAIRAAVVVPTRRS